MTVSSQTSLPKAIQPQNYVVTTEQPPGNQTGDEPVPFLNCHNNCSTDIQKSEQQITTTSIGNTTIPPFTTTTPLFEEGLVRDEKTKEVYLPLTSTIVLKRKQELIYVPLDFNDNLTVDDLLDSKTYISGITQNDLDKIKQKSPNNILKIDNPSIFQIQVANDQLETATLEF